MTDRDIRPIAPVRVALMGAGKWGINLARVLEGLDEFGLVAVADPDPSALARAGRVAPRSLLARDIRDVVDDVEAVVVCTPTGSHAPHGEALLSRGLHVLVEKPMALDVEAAERMRARAAETGCVLAVGHQLLRHACYEALGRIVGAGRIGPLRRIRSVRSSRCNLEREHGVLWSLGPHDVAMILALLGRPPSVVRADPLAVDRAGWPAAVRVRLEFEGGPEAELELDGDTDRRTRLLEVTGDSGQVSFDDGIPGGRILLETTDAGPEELRVTADEPLTRECLGFWKAIRTGDAGGIADGRHGAEVTRVLVAAGTAFGADAYGRAPITSWACR